MKEFHKHYFKTPKELFRTIKKISRCQKNIKKIKLENKIFKVFAEKIMLAVTGINNCIYCSIVIQK